MGKRRHFFISVPNENSIHALNVCIGLNGTQIYSIDKKTLYVKTTDVLINNETEKGIEQDKMFPPGLTEEKTYQEANRILKSSKFKGINELDGIN